MNTGQHGLHPSKNTNCYYDGIHVSSTIYVTHAYRDRSDSLHLIHFINCHRWRHVRNYDKYDTNTNEHMTTHFKNEVIPENSWCTSASFRCDMMQSLHCSAQIVTWNTNYICSGAGVVARFHFISEPINGIRCIVANCDAAIERKIIAAKNAYVNLWRLFRWIAITHRLKLVKFIYIVDISWPARRSDKIWIVFLRYLKDIRRADCEEISFSS